MIEVNLYSIPAGDSNAKVGACIARNRFDRESLGVSIEEFVKGFLKNNLSLMTGGVSDGPLAELINSDSTMTRKDLACINYYLEKAGYKVQIQNVTDDEDNPTGVPSGNMVEWNIIDNNFIQFDYPTAIKIIPNPDQDIIEVIKQIINNSGLFDPDKFAGMKNPFTDLIVNLDRIKNVSGSVNSALVGRIYEILDMVNFDVFCATSEN